MKTLTFILFLFCASAQAQISVGDYSITIESNNAKQGFKLLKRAAPLSMWFYDRYVIVNGIEYYRPGFSLLRRDRAYLIKNGDLKKVLI